MNAYQIASALGPKFRVTPEGDIEKHCSRCERLHGPEEAWWPATLEFFGPDRDNGPAKLHSWCRACHLEAKQISRRQARTLQPASVSYLPGYQLVLA